MSDDPEIGAIGKCVELLTPLGWKTQQRVLEYLGEYLNSQEAKRIADEKENQN